MFNMPIVDLQSAARKLGESGKRVDVLWQDSESIGFIARGREYRSEFHINPSDEVMFMIKGEMRLHYRTPENKEEVAVIPQGATIFTPTGIPHSPRFCLSTKRWTKPNRFAISARRDSKIFSSG